VFDLGPEKILVVLVFALVMFGPDRLPEIVRQIGSAYRQIRGIQDAVHHEVRAALDPDEGRTSPLTASSPADAAQSPELGPALPESCTFE